MNTSAPSTHPAAERILSLTAALRSRVGEKGLTRRDILNTLDEIDASLVAQPRQADGPAQPATVPPPKPEARPAPPRADPPVEPAPRKREPTARAAVPREIPRTLPNGVRLSDRQFGAIRAAAENRILKVRALAGTGKTTLLEGVSHALGGRGLYLAFTKANQVDASRRFPKHVECMTAHALALRHIRSRFPRTKTLGKPWPREVAKQFGFSGPNAVTQGWVVYATFANFCNTLDAAVGPQHVPEQTRELIRRRATSQYATQADRLEAAVQTELQQIASWAQVLWQETIDPKSSMPLGHDAYLKLWIQSGPQLDYDYILHDEYQDCSPVMVELGRNQKCRFLGVGDPFQAIYGWRGAVNAMDLLDAPEAVINETYRFGPEIAAAANSVLALRGSPFLLEGVAPDRGVVGPADFSKPYAYLARTNAGLCVHAAEVCERRPTAMVGGADELVQLLESVNYLWLGQRQQVRHEMLLQFRDFAELEQYAEATGDSEAGLLVRLMEERGTTMPQLVHALRTRLVEEDKAEVVLSSIHRSKGRQFGQVILSNDFKAVCDDQRRPTADPEELNLLYVGASRAMQHLSPNDALRKAMVPAGPGLEESSL